MNMRVVQPDSATFISNACAESVFYSEASDCRLVVIYDDEEARNRVSNLCTNLSRAFGNDETLSTSWWKFSMINERSLKHLASEDVAMADVVIFSVNNAESPESLGSNIRHSYNASDYKLGYVQKASKLMGTSVNTLQDQKLGKVENILIDLGAGRIVALVISSGGFIGIGEELSAIPPTAFKYNGQQHTLQLDATKDSLANSPHFKGDEWPDMSQPSYVTEVYQAYRVEPYFNRTNDRSEPANTPPDNTAKNVRDRNLNTPTPFDQGNSQSDVDITAHIRQEIVNNPAMSVNAKNVKIITQNGHVSLRGPVNTAEEKRTIGEIASRIAQSQNVDNQLEVTLTTSSTK